MKPTVVLQVNSYHFSLLKNRRMNSFLKKEMNNKNLKKYQLVVDQTLQISYLS